MNSNVEVGLFYLPSPEYPVPQSGAAGSFFNWDLISTLYALHLGSNLLETYMNGNKSFWKLRPLLNFFYEKEDSQDLDGIRIAAQQGKALGRPLFLEKLEKSLGRIVIPQRRGRPKKENEQDNK